MKGMAVKRKMKIVPIIDEWIVKHIVEVDK